MVGRREFSALGVSSAYPLLMWSGPLTRHLPIQWARSHRLPSRVARTWSHQHVVAAGLAR